MVRPRRRQQGESVLAQCQSRVGQQRPAMPPKDAGKGAKGKAPPSGDGKISGPKLRTPLDDAEYAKRDARRVATDSFPSRFFFADVAEVRVTTSLYPTSYFVLSSLDDPAHTKEPW